MGIKGLLKFVDKAIEKSNVGKFSGCTAAIDAYGWLYKGAYGCAEKLALEEPTTAYINYCMKFIQVLKNNNIKPILVLDGRNLPSKEPTETKRKKAREENKILGKKYLQEGKKQEAWDCFTKCIDITPAMAREFIKVLRSMKIDYVVAPYEADPQLAYLVLNGFADIIITEDSDLILFGCPRMFEFFQQICYKMKENGDCDLFNQSKLPECLGLNTNNFDFKKFRWMCILSGCDYHPSLPGIGLARAKQVIRESNHNELREIIYSIPKILTQIQVTVTKEYEKGFIRAENTFLYQLVFDTKNRMLLPLNPYQDGIGPSNLTFAGSFETSKIAADLALGNVDVDTLEIIDSFEPTESGYTESSIWSSSFKPKTDQSISTDSKMATVAKGQTPAQSNLKRKRFSAVSSSDDDDVEFSDEDLWKWKPKSSKQRKQNDFCKKFNSSSKESVEKKDKSIFKTCRTLEPNTDETGKSNSTSIVFKNMVLPFQRPPDAANKVFVKSRYFCLEGVKTAESAAGAIGKSNANKRKSPVENKLCSALNDTKSSPKNPSNKKDQATGTFATSSTDTIDAIQVPKSAVTLTPSLTSLLQITSTSQKSTKSTLGSPGKVKSTRKDQKQLSFKDILNRQYFVVVKKISVVKVNEQKGHDFLKSNSEKKKHATTSSLDCPKERTSPSHSLVLAVENPSLPKSKSFFRRPGLSKKIKNNWKQPRKSDNLH